MKKLFLALILILFVSSAYSQKTINTGYYNAGITFNVTSFAMDTAGSGATAVYTTDYFDGSGLDGQTIYLTYDCVTPGNTSDSVMIILQGYLPTGSSGMVLNCDTVFAIGSTASSIKQLTLSPTGFAPLYRLRFTHFYGGAADQKNAAISAMKANLYAKSIDAVYKWNKSWY